MALIRLLASCAILTAMSAASPDPDTANSRMVERDAFTIIGISARTNNANEAGPNGIIGKQWQRLMSEHLLSKIPNKIGPEIYAIYTDYASDANGDYTYILGAKVNPNAAGAVPEGMVRQNVPGGRFAIFTSERGPVQQVVPETWKRIWSYFETPQNGRRAYRADYELYDQRAGDPTHAQVDIYIGLK